MQDLSNEARQNISRGISRRTFVKTAATVAAATTLPPDSLLPVAQQRNPLQRVDPQPSRSLL